MSFDKITHPTPQIVGSWAKDLLSVLGSFLFYAANQREHCRASWGGGMLGKSQAIGIGITNGKDGGYEVGWAKG